MFIVVTMLKRKSASAFNRDIAPLSSLPGFLDHSKSLKALFIPGLLLNFYFSNHFRKAVFFKASYQHSVFFWMTAKYISYFKGVRKSQSNHILSKKQKQTQTVSFRASFTMREEEYLGFFFLKSNILVCKSKKSMSVFKNRLKNKHPPGYHFFRRYQSFHFWSTIK